MLFKKSTEFLFASSSVMAKNKKLMLHFNHYNHKERIYASFMIIGQQYAKKKK